MPDVVLETHASFLVRYRGGPTYVKAVTASMAFRPDVEPALAAHCLNVLAEDAAVAGLPPGRRTVEALGATPPKEVECPSPVTD